MPGIHAIYRYPVKGLSPELLPRVELTPGEPRNSASSPAS
jgi:hypothetical protein